jgi:hypothetical protein
MTCGRDKKEKRQKEWIQHRRVKISITFGEEKRELGRQLWSSTNGRELIWTFILRQ